MNVRTRRVLGIILLIFFIITTFVSVLGMSPQKVGISIDTPQGFFLFPITSIFIFAVFLHCTLMILGEDDNVFISLALLSSLVIIFYFYFLPKLFPEHPTAHNLCLWWFWTVEMSFLGELIYLASNTTISFSFPRQ